MDSEIKYCHQSDESQYPASHISSKGFLAAFQFLSQCKLIYGASMDGPDLWYEILDLQTRDVHQISAQDRMLLQTLKSYGVVVSKDEILKAQTFPSR